MTDQNKFVIYGLEPEVKSQLFAYAKIYSDGRIADVIKKGMDLIKQDEAEIKGKMDNRITILEDRVAKLEKEAYNES